MTPDDVAAIRARVDDCDCLDCDEIRTLCDALEQAWAALDEAYEVHVDNHSRQADYWRERAERAEAEHLNQVRLNLKMDAALARVRALCDPAVLPPEASRLARSIRVAGAELGKFCPHRTSESNGSYWVCCSCGEYLRKANQ